jgi:hypothetical protein
MPTTNKQDQEFGNVFLEKIINWISDNMEAEDIFSEDHLDRWAKDNGYVREEDI